MISYSNCPVCLSEDLAFVMEVKDHSITKEVFRLTECKNCQLRITSPVPEAESIGRYYASDDYISHSNTNKGLINMAYQSVRNWTLKSKKRMISSFSGLNSGKLLDYGSGTGEFLSTMKNEGWEVEGIEPSDIARNQAIAKFGLNVKPYPELFNLPENQFNVITLWHVLEHVHDLDKVMKKINSLLITSGSLIIAVPNYQSTDAKHYREFWAAYDVPRHLYHFSSKSVSFLLTRNGFKLIEKRRMPFDAFYVSMLSEKYKGRGIIPALFIGAKSWLSSLFQIGNTSSLIYLAKKV